MYGSWVWEGWLGGRVGVLAGILSIAWAAFSSFPALQTGVTRWDKVGGEIISISSLSGLRTASVQLTHSIAQHVGKDAGFIFMGTDGVQRTALLPTNRMDENNPLLPGSVYSGSETLILLDSY